LAQIRQATMWHNTYFKKFLEIKENGNHQKFGAVFKPYNRGNEVRRREDVIL
jgi:hypothetical protein